MPTATPFNNLITFSRGSNATVTGSNGLIQWAPNNLLTFSEQFDNANWPKQDVTVTANIATAPDGSITADLMYPTTTGISRRILRSTSLIAGNVYTQSLYVKAAGKRWVYLNGIDASSAANDCWFDVQNGVVGTKGASVLNAVITAVGDGWYRLSTTGLVGVNNFFYLMAVDNNGSYTSTTNGTDGVLIWGAQLELGSTATTYNSTTVKNLLGFSEAFDNAAWTKTRASIVTGAQANPVNGLFNAQKLMVDTTAASTHSVSQEYSLGASVPVTVSVYVKAAEYTTGRLTLIALSGAFPEMGVTFNLTAGTITASASSGTTVLGSSITQLSSGWYRVSISGFTGLSGLHRVVINPNTNSAFTGDGNSGVYIYGAQLSDSASLDPYVPTPGAAPSSTAFYGPRFDFDPVTLQPRGILIEEQRTNLTLQSEAITSSPWTFYNGSNGTAIAAITSPSGAVNGIGLNDTSASGYYGVTQTVNISTTTTYTFTTYVKQGTSTAGFSVWLIGNNSNTYYQNTIAWTGGVPTAAGWTATNVGNGWYRIAYTFASLTSTNVAIYLLPCPTVLADTGTSYFWGAQLEAGAFATSYIPTVASTVTRSTDIVAINGSLFSQWYGQSEGTFISDATTSGDVVSSYNLTALNAASNNIVGFDIDVGGVYRLRVTDGGVNQALVQAVAATSANTTYKIAGAYRTNDFAASANGGTVATDTSGTVPSSMVSFAIGSGSTATGVISWNGHIRNIRFIPARAADFQLQALST